jgi:hypothetical protein
MTLDEYATMLEASLRRLTVQRQPWVTPEDTAAMVQTLKRQVSDADRVLQRPSTPETDAARGKLMARASVKSYEEKGTLV